MSPTTHNLPRPTYWPLFFSIGITTIAWGLVTSWIVCAVGSAVLFVSMIGWAREVSK